MRILHRLSSDFVELFFRTCRCRKNSVYIENIFIIIIPVSRGVNSIYNIGGIIINVYNKYIFNR